MKSWGKNYRRQKYVLLFAAISVFLIFIGWGRIQGLPSSGTTEKNKISDTGFYFDTVVSITLYGTENEHLIEECFSLMEKYEAMLSRTKEESDIWKINHSNGAVTKVTEETASLIEKALTYCELSRGAFDITIAPVVDLWDFHGEGALPDTDLLVQAVSHVDYHNVQVQGTSVTLSDSEAAIDLGGIAKGYIADKLKEFLVSEGVTSGLIDLGGNILTIGQKMDGSDWNIGIRKPFAQTAGELVAAVPVKDLSVVTSGTYERYFEKDGVLYHHILNPKNGYPAETGVLSVSILSSSSAEGDALSTTCFLMGLEQGMELIEAMDGVEAMFITEDGAMHKSSGFPE